MAAWTLAGSAPTVSAGADTAGLDIYLAATKAGTSTTVPRAGGLFSLAAGAGGPAATTIVSGAGGAIQTAGGAAGAKTGTTGNAGIGGAWTAVAGAGGFNILQTLEV